MSAKQDIKNLFDAAIKEYASKFQMFNAGENFWKQIYILMWGEYPHIISLATDGCYLNEDLDDYLANDAKEYSEDKHPHFCTFENVSVQKTIASIIKRYKKSALVYRECDYPVIITDHMIIMFSISDDSDMYIFQKDEYLSKEFISLVVENRKDEVDYSYVTCDSFGNIDENILYISGADIAEDIIETNYNDDLPNEEIKEFLKSNESGMVLLHGNAKTGKSAYIQYLINEIRGRHFIIIDEDSAQNINSATLMQLFLKNDDVVLVIEDNSLKGSINKVSQLKNLLSVDDGIIGSNLTYKFICTFNDESYNWTKSKFSSNKVKIDYSFKNLSPEKTKALAELYNINIKEGESLPLSTIIKGNENDAETKTNYKIGFGK